TITTESVLISIPIGILVGAINMSNNIRDIEEDIKGGRKTLVILLGREKAVVTLAIAFFIAYLWIAVIVWMGYISPWALVMFLGLRKPISAIQSFQKGAKDPGYMRIAMKSTAMTNTIFGFLLSAGLLISYLF
ncbi:TPA: UbiA family prenyltransferase, partial [Bacillus anthracis]|nr:UbiA family prenyltransferase [Bacillus anthracis]